jgi:spermidine synthase
VPGRPSSPSSGAKALPTPFGWLILLTALSGCAALIYEIVWFQLLQFVIGSTAISLGILLAGYMGGLCIGSTLFARRVPPTIHPMRVYCYLEAGIALWGLIALLAIPLAGRIYFAGPSTGALGMVWRGLIAAICLLPPTALMGAAFPALSRLLETTTEGVARLGILYSANIAGAVAGCLGAGFYLLRVFDAGVATYVAVAINILTALLARYLTRADTQLPAPEPTSAKRRPGWPLVYTTIALSGLTALGAEVVWTRLLSLLLGATVYAFSIILAVFLIGLWAGSAAGASIARRVSDPKLALAASQGLLALAIALGAVTIATLLPHWPVDPWVASSPWYGFDLDMLRVMRTILPATLLWGASFPLALASVSVEGEDPARVAGEVYAVNTLGSIIGALTFTLLLVPGMGTRGSQQMLIWLAAAAGAVAIASAARSAVFKGITVAAGLAIAWLLAGSITDVPWQLFAFGRRVAPKLREAELSSAVTAPALLYSAEGMNASIAIAERAGERSFYVSGKSEASTTILDMRLQRMMGHLPALLHGSAKSILIVGFGAGTTAGAFVPYPDVQSITICELEPLIPPASNQYFAAQNYRVLDDPRTRVIYDDARHFISTTPDKFDIITTDPIHPFVKGTSALYSREYYEVVKQHLNPGGVVAQWLPVYDSDAESVKTQLATFFAVFPRATVWSNYLNGEGYDLVLIGRLDDAPVNLDAMQTRLDQPSYARVAKSLAEVEFPTAVDFMATYAGNAQDLAPAVAGAQLNEDLSLRLQYLAGLGLDSMSAARTYQDLLAYRKFPEGLFTGSDDKLAALRAKFGHRRRVF